MVLQLTQPKVYTQVGILMLMFPLSINLAYKLLPPWTKIKDSMGTIPNHESLLLSMETDTKAKFSSKTPWVDQQEPTNLSLNPKIEKDQLIKEAEPLTIILLNQLHSASNKQQVIKPHQQAQKPENLQVKIPKLSTMQISLDLTLTDLDRTTW